MAAALALPRRAAAAQRRRGLGGCVPHADAARPPAGAGARRGRGARAAVRAHAARPRRRRRVRAQRVGDVHQVLQRRAAAQRGQLDSGGGAARALLPLQLPPRRSRRPDGPGLLLLRRLDPLLGPDAPLGVPRGRSGGRGRGCAQQRRHRVLRGVPAGEHAGPRPQPVPLQLPLLQRGGRRRGRTPNPSLAALWLEKRFEALGTDKRLLGPQAGDIHDNTVKRWRLNDGGDPLPSIVSPIGLKDCIDLNAKLLVVACEDGVVRMFGKSPSTARFAAAENGRFEAAEVKRALGAQTRWKRRRRSWGSWRATRLAR